MCWILKVVVRSRCGPRACRSKTRQKSNSPIPRRCRSSTSILRWCRTCTWVKVRRSAAWSRHWARSFRRRSVSISVAAWWPRKPHWPRTTCQTTWDRCAAQLKNPCRTAWRQRRAASRGATRVRGRRHRNRWMPHGHSWRMNSTRSAWRRRSWRTRTTTSTWAR